jgi:hypothetical protein
LFFYIENRTQNEVLQKHIAGEDVYMKEVASKRRLEKTA